MDKEQRLRNTAEGFMAGLVACGFRGPWQWRHLDWELPFYPIWNAWPPQQRNPKSFPTFEVGGGPGRTSEGRNMLFQLKQTSPFHNYRTNELPSHPFGMEPDEYLAAEVEGADPDEWIVLAQAFLDAMEAKAS